MTLSIGTGPEALRWSTDHLTHVLEELGSSHSKEELPLPFSNPSTGHRLLSAIRVSLVQHNASDLIALFDAAVSNYKQLFRSVGVSELSDCQQLARDIGEEVDRLTDCYLIEGPLFPSESLLRRMAGLLADPSIPASIRAETLALPVPEGATGLEVEAKKGARAALNRAFVDKYTNLVEATLSDLRHQDPDDSDAMALQRLCMDYLGSSHNTLLFQTYIDRWLLQASTYEESVGAIRLLLFHQHPMASQAIEKYYRKYSESSEAMIAWIKVQAADLRCTTERLAELEKKPIFNDPSPEMLRALLGTFGRNTTAFHHHTGAGYDYVLSRILPLSNENSGLAIELAAPFLTYQQLTESQQKLMQTVVGEYLEASEASEDLARFLLKAVDISVD